MADKEALENKFSELQKCKNIFDGQEGILKNPKFSNEFGEKPKVVAYMTQKVKVKNIFAENNSRWVKFENFETGKEFRCSLKNAYDRFRVTKELSPDELGKASAEKAREKLKNVDYVMKRIQQGLSIDAVMRVAGLLKEKNQLAAEREETTEKTPKKKNSRKQEQQR